MTWESAKWVITAAIGLGVILVAQFVYLAVVLSWEDQKTVGLGYYGLPPEDRERFKRALHCHARLLRPVLRVLGGFSKFTFAKGSFRQGELRGPKGTCSVDSFARAASYTAQPSDVFVVTQMKCGTTWMQHVVYEVLRRGRGTLVEDGTTLYAVSPWLEARKSVSVEEAPLVGTERPSRIIKTHFPSSACPYSLDARYIYVARHPVSCFASCVDFLHANLGAFAPDVDQIEEWFRSPNMMWWGTWTDHVHGWWDVSSRNANVLFVHFEEMKDDLRGVVERVASFLDLEPLDSQELADITRKCGFAYMQEHQDTFEMHPPHIMAVDAELFVKGTADRHADAPAETKHRILEWVAAELMNSTYPLAQFYPDVTAAVHKTTASI